jgi:hypothetical protein
MSITRWSVPGLRPETTEKSRAGRSRGSPGTTGTGTAAADAPLSGHRTTWTGRMAGR